MPSGFKRPDEDFPPPQEINAVCGTKMLIFVLFIRWEQYTVKARKPASFLLQSRIYCPVFEVSQIHVIYLMQPSSSLLHRKSTDYQVAFG